MYSEVEEQLYTDRVATNPYYGEEHGVGAGLVLDNPFYDGRVGDYMYKDGAAYVHHTTHSLLYCLFCCLLHLLYCLLHSVPHSGRRLDERAHHYSCTSQQLLAVPRGWASSGTTNVAHWPHGRHVGQWIVPYLHV